jgi:Flp pilus assembly protein TadB
MWWVNVNLTKKTLGLLLIVLVISTSILVAIPNNYYVVSVGLTLYAISLIILLIYCEKMRSMREFQGVLQLIVFSTSIGVLLGMFFSPTLLSLLTAISIGTLLLIYTILSTRWYV